MSSPPRRPKKLFYLITFLSSLLLVALMLEIFFAYFFPPTAGGGGFSANPYQYDKTVGLRYRPNWTGRNKSGEFDVSIRTNAQGFRADAPYSPAQADELMAVLGDSFVSANQVALEQRFTELLENRLAASDSRITTIQNYGVDSLGFAHYLPLYREHIRPNRPSLVLIVATPYNDFTDSSPELMHLGEIRPAYIRDETGALVDVAPFPDPPPAWLTGLKGFLWRNVATYRFASVFRSRLATLGSFPDFLLMYQDPWPPDQAAAWDYSAWVLGELAAEIRADNAQPILVLMPSSPILNPDDWRSILDAHAASGLDGALDPDRLRDALRDLSSALDLPFIDLTEPLNAALLADEAPFIQVDGHLSAHGHVIVADFLYAELAPYLED